MATTNEERNREELERKSAVLEKQIELEVSLLLSAPKIVGVIRVVPQVPIDDTLKQDKEVEEIGMRVTMEFERGQGRSPEDIASQNLGFDVRSKAQDESIRYIEVKARALEGKIALTPNEWLMAHRLGSEYWLYVVVNVAKTSELYIIHNPAEKLKPEEEIDVVRYIVSEWKNAAVKEKVGV